MPDKKMRASLGSVRSSCRAKAENPPLNESRRTGSSTCRNIVTRLSRFGKVASLTCPEPEKICGHARHAAVVPISNVTNIIGHCARQPADVASEASLLPLDGGMVLVFTPVEDYRWKSSAYRITSHPRLPFRQDISYASGA